MINSIIDPSITYNETLKVIDEDLEHSASVYESEILGKQVEFVLGKKKENGKLAYFIAYVVLKSGSVRPIGVFEIESDKMDEALDDEGDIDIDKLKGPILFSNVDLSNAVEPDDEEETIDDESSNPQSVTVAPEPPDSNPSPPDNGSEAAAPEEAEIPNADREQEEKERETVATGLWIQQFMQNKNYGILDNEGGGDCLFAVIRDAFQQKGIQYTVGDLRKKLSDEVTEETFLNYKTLYDSFLASIKETKARLKEISAENNALKNKFVEQDDEREQIKIVEAAKKLKDRFYRLKDELAVSQQMLEEQKFMASVSSLDQFKAVLNTCRFWGDTWAISTLERVLNTKFILLSEESFEEDDLGNVLQCGQLNDPILEQIGVFTPDHYIIMDYNGYHYKLITYKDNRMFKFNQLPYGIRDLIQDKCLETMSGPYAIIPDFVSAKLGEESKKDIVEVTDVQTLDYDPNIVFVYYYRSNNKPLPGKGSGEKIPSDQRDQFKKLASIKEWRRKLSNSWVAPMDIDGHQWQSVEHFYQASKYIKGHPEIYYQFTLDSRSELGQSAERARKFNDFEPDIDFSGKYGKEVLARALEAKFTQHSNLREMLLATHNATLKEYIPKSPARPSLELMKLRNNLKVM